MLVMIVLANTSFSCRAVISSSKVSCQELYTLIFELPVQGHIMHT